MGEEAREKEEEKKIGKSRRILVNEIMR